MIEANLPAKQTTTCLQHFSHALKRGCKVIALFIGAILLNPALATGNTDDSASAENPEYAPDVVYPDWFKTSFMELEEDIAEARESGKRLMLVFHQPGCPYCNAFVERNLAQKDIEETVKSNFDVIEINMWGDLEVIDVNGTEFTEKSFARHLKVQFTPTVLMYDQNGAIALRINGYFPPRKFRAALDYVINQDRSEQSFNDHLASINLKDVSDNSQNIKPRPYIDIDDFATDQQINLPAPNTTKPYIILFEQNDCSNCQQFHETVLVDEAISEQLSNFDVIRLDMWGNNNIQTADGNQLTSRELASTLDISYAPTMVVYSPSHTEVIRSESWLKRFHTETILDYVSSGAWQNQPSLQNYIRDRADAIREDGGSVNILE